MTPTEQLVEEISKSLTGPVPADYWSNSIQYERNFSELCRKAEDLGICVEHSTALLDDDWYRIPLGEKGRTKLDRIK